MKKHLVIVCAILSCGLVRAAEAFEEADDLPWGYLGFSTGALLPGNGNTLKRGVELNVRAGRYLTENTALEFEGTCAPACATEHRGHTSVSGVGALGVFHLAGWETFNRLFGYERLDPFVTAGAAARFAGQHVFAEDTHRTALGPVFGFGSFYHLTDNLSLRAEARAEVCCDTPAGMLYSVGAGVQYAFGGGR